MLLVVKEQHTTLEACLIQVEQYQQEVQQLRQQIVQVEQQLRTVLAPTYAPHDREKALEDQQVGVGVCLSVCLRQSSSESCRYFVHATQYSI